MLALFVDVIGKGRGRPFVEQGDARRQLAGDRLVDTSRAYGDPVARGRFDPFLHAVYRQGQGHAFQLIAYVKRYQGKAVGKRVHLVIRPLLGRRNDAADRMVSGIPSNKKVGKGPCGFEKGRVEVARHGRISYRNVRGLRQQGLGRIDKRKPAAAEGGPGAAHRDETRDHGVFKKLERGLCGERIQAETSGRNGKKQRRAHKQQHIDISIHENSF